MWVKEGPCEGTTPPTFAPVPFNPMDGCTYEKCETVSEPCACGSPGCPTSWGQTSGCKRENQSCTTLPVEKFSSSANYVAGDIIRVGAAKFRCKAYPYVGWCNEAAYQPTLEGDNGWSEVWEEAGLCERTVTTELKLRSSMTLSLERCPSGALETSQAIAAIEAAIKTVVQGSLEPDQSVKLVNITSFECSAANRRLVSWLRSLQSDQQSEAQVGFEVTVNDMCVGEEEECGVDESVARNLATSVNTALQDAVSGGEFDDALLEAAQVSGSESLQSASVTRVSWGVAEDCSVTAGGGSDGVTSARSACDFSMVSASYEGPLFH